MTDFAKPEDIEQRLDRFRSTFDLMRNEISKVIAGQTDIVEQVLVSLFSGGHVLLEGVPGLGKTILVRTLAQILHLDFSRIQFTPDLMPSDILGTNLLVEGEDGGRRFTFQAGPVFTNILLADEINRATPKTQSALLEAMQERQVTVGREAHRLEEPFLVLATQNPLEMEGTYPLPEAQLDRFFFKLRIDYPSAAELHAILDRTTSGTQAEVKPVADADLILNARALIRQIPIAREVQDVGVRILLGTHPERSESPDLTRKVVRYGASPRGLQAMVLAAKVYAVLAGRYHVSREDLFRASLPTLRHRVVINFEGEAEGITPDDVLSSVLKTLRANNP